jgi:hypothetical protein
LYPSGQAERFHVTSVEQVGSLSDPKSSDPHFASLCP